MEFKHFSENFIIFAGKFSRKIPHNSVQIPENSQTYREQLSTLQDMNRLLLNNMYFIYFNRLTITNN